MPHVWEMAGMERRYSVPPSTISEPLGRSHPTEDLHAWSIYRQNLNSDFTDSALGSSEKSPLPYGNFQLREATVHSILNHPRYGPRPHANTPNPNMYAYLKFGLPRVFPPVKGLRDGSSGYDSSDEGYPTGGDHRPMDNRFQRTRSDPDFLAHNVPQRPEMSAGSEGPWWGKPRKLRSSSSEANLLQESDAVHSPPTRATRSPKGPPSRRAPASKAGSQLSGVTHTTRSHIGVFGGARIGLDPRDSHLLNETFFPRDPSLLPMTIDGVPEGSVIKYPHIQVRGLSFEELVKVPGRMGRSEKRWFRVLDDVTFEVHGGELLGVLATNEYEGTTLLNILANRSVRKKARLRADLMVNGCRVTTDALWDRLAFVQQDCSFAPDMSVRQTLLFTSLLQESGNQSRTFDTKGRINALIEDLGLGLVKHTRVKNLTMSEKRRLNVACRLLLDTDIVLLDQPTKGMDIFDTFFLIEYLRQWAARGRIVITTLHPPTYEIFTMLTTVALLSTGRLMFFGKRREMLPYFSFIEYPCPAYKNPADYYLDLVTLDTLSPEALLESSQRVDLLAEMFRRRQQALSDPGPPGIQPPKITRSNFLIQMLALWIRALIYMFPYNLIAFACNVGVAATMSIFIGAIFYNVRLGREQEHVMDRIAFHFAMLAVAPWPIFLNVISDVWSFKDIISKDVNDGLYSKMAYILSKMQYSFPAAAGTLVAYIVPAYCMAGMKNEANNFTFSIYVGVALIYLLSVRALALTITFCCRSRHVAAVWLGAIMAIASCTCGWVVHMLDLSVITFWLQWVSPTRWAFEQLVTWDLLRADVPSANNISFLCTNSPVVVQDQGGASGILTQSRIVVRAECGLQNGAQAVAFWGLKADWPTLVPIFAIIAFGAFWQFWATIMFVVCKQRQKKSRGCLVSIYQ